MPGSGRTQHATNSNDGSGCIALASGCHDRNKIVRMGASSAAKAVGENVLVDESKAGNLPDDAIETFADPTKGTADALSQVESRLRNGLMLAIVGTMLASIIAALVVVVIVRRVGR